ncbi:TPR-like protein [Rhodotorula sp. JG-1b]|nr:TPR-like protein [Rhodotorula sp. JG-1b]
MHGNSATTAGAGTADLQALRAEWRARDDDEQDLHLLAQTYMRNHELLRAAHVLRDCTGPKARWTRCYARYLAGEKRVQEEAGELLGVKDRPRPNPYTQELLDELASYEPGFIDQDGWLLYLCSSDLRLAALETLVNSVRAEPYNWSAWLKIAECLDGPEEATTMPFLPSGYPLLFFYVHCSLEIHAANDVLLDIVDELEQVFGRECAPVTGMRALVHYHMRDFDDATAVFHKLHESDPYRLEDLDVLSNILYVSEKRAELATLAQEYTRVDRMRPETCCLVGNYFSLRRDHEKAITYFRRALKLDRSYLSAWTLMGHEYVEIKNTNAAIASYRRAVDVNRKDYRAWYGLGQTYELLGEPYYALNYYQRATALRPYDARMWSALATCNEKLKRVPDAIQCHQRALLATEAGEGSDIALRIGKLYASLGQGDHAAAYHRRALNEGLRSGAGTAELGRIYLWLAKWEMRRGNNAAAVKKGGPPVRGDLGKAEEYLRALEGTQEHRDEAKTLLKELEVQMLSRA